MDFIGMTQPLRADMLSNESVFLNTIALNFLKLRYSPRPRT